ncbi:MAG: type II toxin-antitoxin system Phd/YefM family antitoxin [Deltaproteobacteria bacterium]|nr:type II toxin-antitoxin system Phd/YefM family antitoxin [Deltaproteobacteria bacterium]
MTSRAPSLKDDIQPVSDFRANTAAGLRHVKRTGRPLVLTQNGRAAAVLLDVATYRAMIDETELLRDLRAAQDDIREGRVTPHDEARSALLARYRGWPRRRR